jgi:hemolysin activation/secretion protein
MLPILKRSRLAPSLLLAAALTFAAASASAQSVIDDAARQANEIERENSANREAERLRTLRRTFRAPAGDEPQAPAPAPSGPGATCLEINRIRVDGVTLLDPGEIRKTAARWEGKCLDLTGINNVLEALTHLYMRRGYIAARAYVPEQDLSGGTLLITVVEGQLEGIRSPDGSADTGQMKTAFPGITGTPVNLRDLEQGVDQINRLRSQNAHIDLRAGEAHGGSILDLTVTKTKPWWVSVSMNNHGGAATGRTQSRMEIGRDNVLGLNDEWTFGYQRSMKGGPLGFTETGPHSNGYNASVSIPYGYWLFGLDGNWTDYRTTLKTPEREVETSGHSKTLSAYATRVLHRDQVAKTWVTGRIARKSTDNFLLGAHIDANSRVLTVATMELGHSRRIAGGELTALAGFHQGIRAFNALEDDPARTEDTPKAQFSKITGSITYGRPFKLGGRDMKFRSTLSGQWSNDLLFGSEQLSIGGPSSVRGTAESLYYGNSGVYLRNEISAPLAAPQNAKLAKVIGRLEPYAALDVGHVPGSDSKNTKAGSAVGATVGIRNSGAQMKFELSYSNILATSGPRPSSAGISQARVSFSF